MKITTQELLVLETALNYMENAITDVVGWANDPNTKLKYMHECKRIHAIAISKIENIKERKLE